LTAAALAALWNAQAGTKKPLPRRTKKQPQQTSRLDRAYAQTLGNIPEEAIGNQFRNKLE
jgi:hypothetical protein